MDIIGLLEERFDDPLLLPRVVELAAEEFGQVEVEDIPIIVVEQNGGHVVALLLEEVVAELVEVDEPQLEGQVLGDVDEDVVADVESLHHCDFVLVAQQNQQLVLGAVMELDDQLVFVVVVRFLEVQLETSADLGLEVFELVDGLAGSHEGDVLGLRAEIGSYYLGEAQEVDDVDGVEAVVEVVSDLVDAVVPQDHEIAHLLVVEVAYDISDRHFAAIIAVFALDLLRLQVNLEDVLVSIEDEEVRLAAHVEALLVSDIGGVETIVLPDFPKQH